MKVPTKCAGCGEWWERYPWYDADFCPICGMFESDADDEEYEAN